MSQVQISGINLTNANAETPKGTLISRSGIRNTESPLKYDLH